MIATYDINFFFTISLQDLFEITTPDMLDH